VSHRITFAPYKQNPLGRKRLQNGTGIINDIGISRRTYTRIINCLHYHLCIPLQENLLEPHITQKLCPLTGCKSFSHCWIRQVGEKITQRGPNLTRWIPGDQTHPHEFSFFINSCVPIQFDPSNWGFLPTNLSPWTFAPSQMPYCYLLLTFFFFFLFFKNKIK